MVIGPCLVEDSLVPAGYQESHLPQDQQKLKAENPIKYRALSAFMRPRRFRLHRGGHIGEDCLQADIAFVYQKHYESTDYHTNKCHDTEDKPAHSHFFHDELSIA